MSDEQTQQEQGRAEALLRPARPDPEELRGRPPYMPRLPWKWILLFGGGFVLVTAVYQVRQRQRADALRSAIVASYEEHLRPLSERYVEFRERLERWTIEAAQAGEPERWVDPRLRISGLHAGEGIYLRVPAAAASSPETLAAAARTMTADALTRCLGLAPASARGLYEAGEFLQREWLDEHVRAESDLMRLRVLDEQLARNMQVDVPAIASMLASEYFLLVIQQGENRRQAPVDVYLWDLREHRLLMRGRFQGRGILLPVRLRFDGVPPVREPEGRPDPRSVGAYDCSIAAQIKELTGEAALTIESGAALERPSEPQAPAEAVREPSEPPSGEEAAER